MQEMRQVVSKAKRCKMLFRNKQPLVARASKRQCPGEALLLVVKVVRVVFPCVHVRRQGTCPARGLEGKGGTFCCNNLL